MTIIKNTQRGSIIQVKYTQVDTADSQSLTANTPADINNFDSNILPLKQTLLLDYSLFFGEYNQSSICNSKYNVLLFKK